MANMGRGKTSASSYTNTKYDKKTSKHGHYERERIGTRRGSDGSTAPTYAMRWVEDNRKVSAPAPAPKPKPKPVEKKIEPGTFKVSPEIQQAKDRVNAYEKNKSPSPWEQAQANVQSSFIKPSTSSDSNQQYDFASKSFNAKQSSDPNVANQSAQSNPEDYISKYSQYKSSN